MQENEAIDAPRAGTVRWRALAARLAPAAVWCAAAAVFYRAAVFSRFRDIQGDEGDARLVIYIHEHWWRVIRGLESWRDPSFFYPIDGTLGYSDTLVLNSLVFIPLRVLGFDQFVAFQLTMIIISGLGFAAFYLLCRRWVHLDVGASCALATLGIFANNLFMASRHPQLQSVHWVPVVVLAACGSWRLQGRRRAAALAGGGLLAGTLVVSAYYVAWAAVFACGVAGAITVGLWLRGKPLAAAMAGLSLRWRPWGAWLAGFAVGLGAFAVIYLPVLRTFGGRRYEESLVYAGTVGDLVNVGSRNVVWGPLLRAEVADRARLDNIERALAVTPLLLALFGLSTAVAVHAVATGRRFRGDALAVGCAGAAAVLMLVPLRWGAFSPWVAVWHVVPGAVGIRATYRLQLVAGLLAVAVVALGWQALRAAGRPQLRRASRPLFAIALCVAVAEQINLSDQFDIDRRSQERLLESVPTPPTECTSFFVTASQPLPVPYEFTSTAAMIISQAVDLPTLNGYSGQSPVGFPRLDASDPNNVAAHVHWATEVGIDDGLCTYDLSSSTWASADIDS